MAYRRAFTLPTYLFRSIFLITIATIINEFKELIQHHSGDLQVEISKTAPSDTTESAVIVFATSEDDFEKAIAGSAIALVIHSKFADKIPESEKVILLSDNPYLAMALVGQRFFPITNNKTSYSQQAIHPRAVIGENTAIGTNTLIGPNAVIGDNVTIGDDCTIGPNTTIENNVIIGNNCHIYAQCFIAHSCELGTGVEVQPTTTIGTPGYGYAHDHLGAHHHIPHYGRVILEDNVQVGAGVNIDRGVFDDTVIGKGTKIDNHCHFAHNLQVGENCLITAGFIVAGSTKIGNNYVTGGRVSVGGHMKIGDNIQTAAMTVVTKHLDQPGHYAGYPIQDHRDALKTQISMTALPEMRKDLKALKRAAAKKD